MSLEGYLEDVTTDSTTVKPIENRATALGLLNISDDFLSETFGGKTLLG